jgi:hypothetical protein
MTTMPGNMMKISHAEAIASNHKPETQTSGFQEFPKQVGWSKPTEAEEKEAERTKIPFVPKAIIAKNAEDEAKFAGGGAVPSVATDTKLKGASWGTTKAAK